MSYPASDMTISPTNSLSNFLIEFSALALITLKEVNLRTMTYAWYGKISDLTDNVFQMTHVTIIDSGRCAFCL